MRVIILFMLPLATNLAAANSFNNSIHNFSNDTWGTTDWRYEYPSKHAKALYYRDVLNGSGGNPTYSGVGNMHAMDSSFLPVQLDMTAKTAKFIPWYLTDWSSKASAYSPSHDTWSTYALAQGDLDLLNGYGCSKISNPSLTTSSTLSDMQTAYYYDSGYKTPYANLQSYKVVSDLVNWAIHTVVYGDPTIVSAYFDNLAPSQSIASCANKDYFGTGSYPSWEAGHKDFVKQVTAYLHSFYAPNGDVYRVSGNIWSAAAVATTFQTYYLDGSVQLDHYYLEQGTTAANGTFGGLPAYTSVTGYLPANKVSTAPTYSKCTDTTWTSSMIDADLAYAASIAGIQGSWLGWYGGCGLDSKRSDGSLVYGNYAQLVRVIPNWDNLSGVALASRSYNSTAKVYSSPNAYISPHVAYTFPPAEFGAARVFAVFKDQSESIMLPTGRNLGATWWTDNLFQNANVSANSCLKQSGNRVTLTCTDKVGIGILGGLK